MDDEEEQKEYGFSTKKATIALSGNMLMKEKTKDEVSVVIVIILMDSIWNIMNSLYIRY